jgi:hypothetical protein
VVTKLFFAASLLLTGCETPGLRVKVYYLNNEAGGLVRLQDKEVIYFKDAEGFRCMNQADFDATVEFVRSCMERKP